MTMGPKKLRNWEESMSIRLTSSQRTAILERFSEEPEPYEWSEQDMAVQIHNFLECGEWEKSMRDNSNGGPSTIPVGEPF